MSGEPTGAQFIYDRVTKCDTRYSTARTAAVTILFTPSGVVTTQLVGYAGADPGKAAFGLVLLALVLPFLAAFACP